MNLPIASMTATSSGLSFTTPSGLNETISFAQIPSGIVTLGDGRYAVIRGATTSVYAQNGTLLSSVTVNGSTTRIAVVGRSMSFATPTSLSKLHTDITVCQDLFAAYGLALGVELAAIASVDPIVAALAAAESLQIKAELDQDRCF